MATALKLRSDIKKLKKAIDTKGISAAIKVKLRNQLEKAENELASMQKGGKPRKVSTTKGTATTLTALQKLIKRKKYGVYQGKGVDLKKDAGEGAKATGRRVSKGLKANQFGSKGQNKGNVYYEYRPNRIDVKQPSKKAKYPKLEKGGETEKKKVAGNSSLSATAKYVPNRDVKELSVVISNSLKNLKGSDILDGVYVKKSALSSLSKKVSAKKLSSSLSVDEVYDGILKKADELGGLDEGDDKKIKKEEIKKLLDAGYNSEDINIIYLGADALEKAKIDKEYFSVSGLMSYRDDAISEYIDKYVKVAKEGKFELGLKYPQFNWSDIVKKYKISKQGKEIDGKLYEYTNEKEHYVYTIFEGDKIVLGTSTNRVRYKDGKKQPEDNYYKRDPKELANFQGGYWGLVSSSKEVIKDIVKMILRKGSGYVKDIDVFVNALGGVDATDLDENDIKYEHGGLNNPNPFNIGASWSIDRARHNKSEDYEIPMNKRKLEDGGVISKTHRIG